MIVRELKNYRWLFDEENKRLTLFDKRLNNSFSLDKVRLFSLFRFLIRISQRMSTPRRKKKEVK